MTLLGQILSQSTIVGVLIAILLWILAKFIDTVLKQVLDRQVFGTFYNRIVQRLKIFRTRYDPISSTFRFTFTLSENPSFETARNRMRNAIDVCERLSEAKIKFGAIKIDDSGESIYMTVDYLDNNRQYDLNIELTPNVDSIRSGTAETTSEAMVNTIAFTIDFKFSFNNLDSALMNLGAFVRFLEKSINEEFRGRSSSGQFTIQPLETDLTLDEWIEEERFDVSVLLKSEDQKTSVEFFGDHAVVTSPYLEIDSETTKYIRATLLNYYL